MLSAAYSQVSRRISPASTTVVRGEPLTASAHPVPILIGGNSPDVHAAAAESADIVRLVGFSPSRGGTGIETSDFATDALERQVARLRKLAGPRFSQLQLHALVQWHEVTDDRCSAAERATPCARGFGRRQPSTRPTSCSGRADEIATQLREHHERFGITRWTVSATDLTSHQQRRSSPCSNCWLSD